MKWILPVPVQLSVIFLLHTYVSGNIDLGTVRIEQYEKRLGIIEGKVTKFSREIKTMLVEENGTRNSAKLEEIAAEIENFGETENLKAFGNEIDAWFNKVTQMLDPKSASNLSGKFLVGVQTQQQNTVKVDPKANTSQSQPVVKKEKTKLTVVIPPVKAPPSHQRPPSKVQPAPVPLTTTNDPQNGNAEVEESLPSPASNAAYYTPSSGSPNQIPSPFQSANSPNFVPPNIDASTFGLQTSNGSLPFSSSVKNKRPGSGGRRPGSGGGRPGSGGKRPGSGPNRPNSGPRVSPKENTSNRTAHTSKKARSSPAQQAISVQHARVAQEHVEFSTNSEADGSDNSKADMTRALWN